LDAAYILQVMVGKRTFDAHQNLACDVTGNGTLSSLDAARILQLVVGKISRLPVADACGSDWVFVPDVTAAPNQTVADPAIVGGSCQPGAIDYDAGPLQATGQDFIGILFGDCSGNWQPAGGAGGG